MIDMNLADLLGGEPIGEHDMATEGDVFYIHAKGGRIVEKLIAADAKEALAKGKELVGEAEALFVTGPHEVDAAAPQKG